MSTSSGSIGNKVIAFVRHREANSIDNVGIADSDEFLQYMYEKRYTEYLRSVAN